MNKAKGFAAPLIAAPGIKSRAWCRWDYQACGTLPKEKKKNIKVSPFSEEQCLGF